MSRPASMQLRQTVVSVPAATDTVLVAFNPLRKYLAIANIGTGLASLGFDQVAVVNSGYPLAPAASLGAQGGGLVWEAGVVPLNGMHCISTAGTTVVVLEGS
jgi:hypothetical protein